MRKVGLLCESHDFETPANYHRIICQKANETLGSLPLNNFRICSLDSVNLDRLQEKGVKDLEKNILTAAKYIEASEAEFILACSDRIDTYAESIAKVIKIPYLHRADVLAEKMRRDNVGLVGIMEAGQNSGSLRQRLLEQYGIETIALESQQQSRSCRYTSEEGRMAAMTEFHCRGVDAVIACDDQYAQSLRLHPSNLTVYSLDNLHAHEAANWAIAV